MYSLAAFGLCIDGATGGVVAAFAGKYEHATTCMSWWYVLTRENTVIESVASVGHQAQGAGIELPSRRQHVLHAMRAQCVAQRCRAFCKPPISSAHLHSIGDQRVAKRHQAVSRYWHTQATLACWCRIRSYLDSAVARGLTDLHAVSSALAGKPWLPAVPPADPFAA
jgi:hypothetical protein